MGETLTRTYAFQARYFFVLRSAYDKSRLHEKRSSVRIGQEESTIVGGWRSPLRRQRKKMLSGQNGSFRKSHHVQLGALIITNDPTNGTPDTFPQFDWGFSMLVVWYVVCEGWRYERTRKEVFDAHRLNLLVVCKESEGIWNATTRLRWPAPRSERWG